MHDDIFDGTNSKVLVFLCVVCWLLICSCCCMKYLCPRENIPITIGTPIIGTLSAGTPIVGILDTGAGASVRTTVTNPIYDDRLIPPFET